MHLDIKLLGIDRDMLGANRFIARRHAARFGAAQHRFDSRHHFRRVEGLHHVIIRAEPQPHQFINVLIQRGDHDDRHRALFAHRAQDAPAIMDGQLNIK